ncbi:MAG: GAF domain-containing protein [Anaerolineae bacterium]|jgi:GAF domain-containing protein
MGHASDRVAAEIEVEVRSWRQRVLNILLLVASAAALAVAVGSIFQSTRETEKVPQVVLYLSISAFLVSLTLLRQLDSRLRAWGLFVLGYMVAVAFMVSSGPWGAGMVFLLALPALGLIVLGTRSGLIMTLLSVLVYGAVAIAAGTGWIQVIPGGAPAGPGSAQWLSQGLLFGFLLILLVVIQGLFARVQTDALQAARENADELGTARDQLQFRTEELDRYARLLEVSTRISREVTGLLEPEALLTRAVNLIADQLGLERAGIYLVEKASAEPRLVAAATAKGETAAVDEAVPVVVAGAVRVPLQDGNLSPEDRGLPRELALPLEVGGQVAGALYLRSSRSLIADRDELVVLQAVADQVAIALENARLYADAQTSLREIDALYRHYAGEAWQHFLAERPKPAQRWGSGQVADGSWRPLFEEAQASGRATTGLHVETGHYLLAVPIKLRDVAIGVLGFHRPPARGPWQMADIVTIEAVATRLALISDNLRLLDEAQRRAARERLTRQATARMRASLDVEAVLTTAADEIAGVLGLAALDLRLVSGEGPEDDGPGSWQTSEARRSEP